MATFFNKPQLGQAQLQQAQKTTESGVDNAANSRAQQANQSVDALLGLAGSAQKIFGKYQANIEAKDRLESGAEIPFYKQAVEEELNRTENLESLGREGLNSKLDEIKESFMERYKDKPFSSQLSNDIDGLRSNVLTGVITRRDNLHVQKVSDHTSQNASSFASQYADGSMSIEDIAGSLQGLMQESTIAHQVPSSTEMGLEGEGREKYKTLTQKQSRDSIMQGLMIQTGQPKNSKVADLLANKEFRKQMGISPTDVDYNKMVEHARKKGVKADKVVYEQGVDNFKEQLYSITNMGIPVDIDMEIKGYKESGQDITAQDEHKLRKAFKLENATVVTSEKYREQLVDGKDLTVNMTKKDREALYDRAFSDTLDLTASGVSVSGISGSLRDSSENQATFRDYIGSGGKLPATVKRLFNVPAGAGVDKWDEANDAIMAMESAASGSGVSVEAIIGVEQVSKVRGLSRLLNDETMDEATKASAIEAFHTNSASFNSKGYLRGTSESKIDTEWLNSVSTDAPWTTDDYVSDQQNADEINGNYEAYRMAGHNQEKAQELALDLFESSNTNFEMPNGGELVIPKAHRYLNNESILAFSKDASRFPSIQQQRQALEVLTGEGWVSEWRADRNISVQKSYNYAKTGKYDMLFDGRLVKNSSFTYSELQDFIGTTDHETRTKITGVKTERPFSEVEREANENRKKNIRDRLYTDEDIQHILDLTI